MPPTLALLIPILLTLAGCDLLRQDVTDEPLPPGRRDYVWSIDTLHSGGLVTDIWGSDSNEIWAVMDGGVTPLWHYDGTKWKPWLQQPGPAFYSIFGFEHNNIWAGGNDGKIYHYDGINWKINFTYSKEGVQSPSIRGIWGRNQSELYAIGSMYETVDSNRIYSFILFYNGNRWVELYVSTQNVVFTRVRKSKTGVFLSANEFKNNNLLPNKRTFYLYSGQKLTQIYQNDPLTAGSATINKIGDDIVFVIGNTLNIYSNGRFKAILTIDNSLFGYQVFGRNKSDVFLRMRDGLQHYNGIDYHYLFSLIKENHSISHNAILFDNQVFFIVNDFDSGENYIHIGSLQNIN